MRDIAKQRELRSIDGHPARLAMQSYNKRLGPAANKRYRERLRKDPERYEKVLSTRRLGSQSYETKMQTRVAARQVATRQRLHWTLDEERKLEAMRLEGITCWEIGLALGRSLQAVERKLKKLGLVGINKAE